jgi:hypothetical protein
MSGRLRCRPSRRSRLRPGPAVELIRRRIAAGAEHGRLFDSGAGAAQQSHCSVSHSASANQRHAIRNRRSRVQREPGGSVRPRSRPEPFGLMRRGPNVGQVRLPVGILRDQCWMGQWPRGLAASMPRALTQTGWPTDRCPVPSAQSSIPSADACNPVRLSHGLQRCPQPAQ